MVKLVWPSRDYLPGYVAALDRGWSPDNLRGEAAAREQLAHIADDADAFLGSVGFRWQPGTEALPPHCLGHIGYAVVPWKRARGYATQALRELLVDARASGLRYVELTTRPDNVASQRVILANGGEFVEEFATAAVLGGHTEFRYRVHLDLGSGT